MYLVTGGTGFIGSHLVERLISLGEPVRCLLRRSSTRRYLPTVEIAFADLFTGEGLAEALRGATCVLHLAGVTKACRPADYYAGNAAITAQLVRAMEGLDIRLLYVSSLAAAGPSRPAQPLDEEASPAPVSHYGKSKLEAETIARGASNAVIVRPPVVYGPRDTDVFQLLKSISRGVVLEIAGGPRWFSAIYVKDLVEGILAAARTPAASGRTYYLTHRKPVAWGDLSSTAARIMKKHPWVVRVPSGAAWAVGCAADCWARATRKPSIISMDKITEAQCLYWTCSEERAERELGFTAGTEIGEGLAETLAWYKDSGWLAY